MNTQALALAEATPAVKSKELIIPMQNFVLQDVFQTNGSDELLREIRAKIDAFTLDINSPESRAEATTLYQLIASTKVEIDNMGKEIVAGVKQKISIVDGERKKIRDTLDGWRDELKIPLQEHKKIESDRVARLKGMLEELTALGVVPVGTSSQDIEARMERANKMLGMDWQDYDELSVEAHQKTVTTLAGAIESARAIEEQACENARLREEAEARNRKDAEEAAARAAVEREKQAIQSEKDAAAKRVAEAEAREAQTKEQAQAQADQAAQRERDKIEREVAAKKAEEDARARDQEHRGGIHRDILEKMVGMGVEESIGKALLRAVAHGDIPHLKIIY